MKFEYLQRVVVDAELEVENIGDCCIRAFNDFGEEFYLIIKTELGYTELLEYAPCTPDLSILPPNYHINYSRFEYNQSKIERLIDKFLNDGKRAITQAELCCIEDIVENLINPIDKVFPNLKGVLDG